MFCPNCGNEIDEDALFCGVCGYDLRNDMMPQANSISGIEDDRMLRKKQRRLPLILITAAVLVVAVLSSIVLVVRSNTPERRLQKQLDLGYKYLSELDYEQAKATFEAAIKIDPKNPDGYYGLLDAFVGLGDANGILLTFEKASDNLEEQDVGDIKATVTHEISKMIDEAINGGDYQEADSLTIKLAKVDEDISNFYNTKLSTQPAVPLEDLEQADIVVESLLPETSGERAEPSISHNVPSLADELTQRDIETIDAQPIESQVAFIQRPSDEEIKKTYAEAAEILFEIEFGVGDFFETIYDSNSYGYLVTKPNSTEKLKNELRPYFTDRKTKELFSSEFGNHFYEQDGKLYVTAGDRGADISAGDGWVSKIIDVSKDKIVVVYTQEQLSEDGELVGYYDYEFTYTYTDRWAFDEIYLTY